MYMLLSFDLDHVDVKFLFCFMNFLQKSLLLPNNDEKKNSLFKSESPSSCTLVLITIVLSLNNDIFTSIIAKGEFQ